MALTELRGGQPTYKKRYENLRVPDNQLRPERNTMDYEVRFMATSQPLLFDFIAKRIRGPLLYPSEQAGFRFVYPRDNNFANYIYGAVTAFSVMREEGFFSKVTENTIETYSRKMAERNRNAMRSLHGVDTIPVPMSLPRDELGTLDLALAFPRLHRSIEEITGSNHDSRQRNIDMELGAFEAASLLHLASVTNFLQGEYSEFDYTE
jgi:hypothetical protein